MGELTIDDLEFAPCAFLSTDNKGVIVSVNTTLVEFLSYKNKSGIIGKNIEIIFTIAGRIFFNTHFFPMIKMQGEASEIFFKMRKADGSDLPVMCNANTKLKDGQSFFHYIFMPVTERGKYEQQLLNARKEAEDALDQNVELIAAKKESELHSIILDKQISRLRHINTDIAQFSKIISHDLQEGIRKIAVLSDRAKIKLQNKLPELDIPELNRVNDECRKLRHLGMRLDNFIGLNLKTEERGSCNLNEIIHSAFQHASSNLGYKNCRIIIKDDIPALEGYCNQLGLLFSNLFENSLKFQDENRDLNVVIESNTIKQNNFRAIKDKHRYTDFAQIKISDNGSGFDRDFYPNIFNINKKTDNTGFSFGLAFSKKIVDNHRGSISIMSTPGQGTTVSILLPFHQKI